MTISLLRSNEFDPSMETDPMLFVRKSFEFIYYRKGWLCLILFPQGSHVGLLEYALCALLRQQYLRNFHYSALKPSTLMLGKPQLIRFSMRSYDNDVQECLH